MHLMQRSLASCSYMQLAIPVYQAASQKISPRCYMTREDRQTAAASKDAAAATAWGVRTPQPLREEFLSRGSA